MRQNSPFLSVDEARFMSVEEEGVERGGEARFADAQYAIPQNRGTRVL